MAVMMSVLVLTFLLTPVAARDSGEAQEQNAEKRENGTKLRLGGIWAGFEYRHIRGFYPYYLWHPWSSPYAHPFGLTPHLSHPGYGAGYSRPTDMGKIELKGVPDSAQVYLDDAYAGLAKDLKTIRLPPGAYNLRVVFGEATFEQRLYVLTGKSLDINTQLKKD